MNIWVRVRVLVLNTTFSNISVISGGGGGQFFWCRKPDCPGKTNDLSQVTGKLDHILYIEYTLPQRNSNLQPKW